MPKLRIYVHAFIKNFSEEGDLGRFSRLYIMELVNPTGLIQDAWHEIIDPQRQILQEIIRDIIGTDCAALTIRFCELSIINQCRALVTMQRGDLEHLLGEPLSPELISKVAGHIADFSLAGIRAIGKRKR